MIEYLVKSIFLQAVSLLFFIFLKKEKHFACNRFYLLATLISSIVLPCLSFSAFSLYSTPDTLIATEHMFSNYAQSTGVVNNVAQPIESVTGFNYLPLMYGLYVFGCLFMICRFIKSLLKIRSIVKNCKKTLWNNYLLLITDQHVPPFSFFNNIIFSKHDLNIGTPEPAILTHEKFHVAQKHTIDRLFIEVILLVFWFNPLVWYYRHLLKLNHEFSADHYTTKHLTDYQYVQSLLDYSPSGNLPKIASGNDFNILKQRIKMLGRIPSKPYDYFTKLTLSVLLLITASFFICCNESTDLSANSEFTVVIDAGHGGKDLGAHTSDISEKDIVLQIAKRIEDQAGDSPVHFIFTRNSDDYVSLVDRVKTTNKIHADLLISLHASTHADRSKNGSTIFYDEDTHTEHTRALVQTFSDKLNTAPDARSPRSLYLLKNAVCPAILLELGYLTNTADKQFMTDSDNQKYMARQIIKAIEQYLNSTL